MFSLLIEIVVYDVVDIFLLNSNVINLRVSG